MGILNLNYPIGYQLNIKKEGVKDAYEILIHDALIGDKTFFAHWDEVELSWEWVQPLLDAYRENLVPLHIYPAGTYGPHESDKLLGKNGFSLVVRF